VLYSFVVQTGEQALISGRAIVVLDAAGISPRPDTSGNIA
jgi:hypothetical protein